jgi:hypothetical protein
VALSPIINRPDNLPRTKDALPVSVRLCGFIADAMSYPFTFIPPHSILDGPQVMILAALFWGLILYFCLRGLFWAWRIVGSRAQKY